MSVQQESVSRLAPVASRLTVREARAGDVDEVASIDTGLHGGLDQLPALLISHLKDPNRRARVCLLDDKIIAFQMAHVIDNGTTVIHQSLRLQPHMRAKGLWPIIRAKLSQPLPDFPHISRMALATAVKTVYLRRMLKRPNTLNYVMERPTVRIRPTEADIRRLEVYPPTASTHELLTCEKATAVLQNKLNQSLLFPHGRVILSWEPFRLMSTNIQTIVHRYQGIHSMYATPASNNAQLDLKSTTEGNGEVTSISFGCAYQVPSGLRYDLDYYGHDADDALTHVLRHLPRALNIFEGGELSVEVFLPVALDREALQTAVREKFQLRCLSEGLTFYLFEGPMMAAKL